MATPSDEIRPLFLLSLQRSGSTLLQRMLATHPSVATASEPWVLLPLMYSLHRDGVYAEYQHRPTVAAIEDFAATLPEGMTTYRDEMRRFAQRLYRQSAGPDANYFLDKSPRYALIIDDLVETFPDARFVVLWRNPLSVVASIVETWGHGAWNVETHKRDLYNGLFHLVDGYQRHEGDFHALRYEDLVDDPTATLAGIWDHLGLEAPADATTGFADVGLQGRMGDPTGVHSYREVSQEPLAKWRSTIDNPLRQSWCRRYLEIIGRDRLAVMGYSLDELLAELDTTPAPLAGTAQDAYRSGRGWVRNTFETRLVRRNLSKLPRSHTIHDHA